MAMKTSPSDASSSRLHDEHQIDVDPVLRPPGIRMEAESNDWKVKIENMRGYIEDK